MLNRYALALFLSACAADPAEPPTVIVNAPAPVTVETITEPEPEPARLTGEWGGASALTTIYFSVGGKQSGPYLSGFLIDETNQIGYAITGFIIDNNPNIAIHFFFESGEEMSFTGVESDNAKIAGRLNGFGLTDYSFELLAK